MRKIAITTIYRFGDVEKALNLRDNMILMVDEAHRTQEGDFGEKMHTGMPLFLDILPEMLWMSAL